MPVDVVPMTDSQLTDLQAAIRAEQDRRRAEPHVDSARAELVSDLRDAGTVTGPPAATPETPAGDVPAWASPGTDHLAMYLLGDVVAHSGRIWESAHHGLNHWEPGSQGIDWRIWRDITPVEEPDEPTDPEEPTGPAAWDPQGYPYKVGDRLTYLGVVYEVVQSHTSAGHWTPDVVASLYKVI